MIYCCRTCIYCVKSGPLKLKGTQSGGFGALVGIAWLRHMFGMDFLDFDCGSYVFI